MYMSVSTSMSRLSLETMPTTRSQARTAEPQSQSQPQSIIDSSSDEEEDSQSDMSEYDDQETPTTIRSPTRLIYRLDKLSARKRRAVLDVFTDPPKIALQKCRRMNDYYAFQMTELVTRSVRIHAAQGTSGPRLSCSCNGETSNDSEPSCPHLLWLLDQVIKQTLYTRDHDKPVTMTEKGYTEEMGDPFQNIADHSIDVLASSLHCPLQDPESDDVPDATRVLEARELLSSIYSTPPDDFRPDIYTHPNTGVKPIKRNDLDRTVFRMLLDNHHFFQYFLSQARSTDPIKDPFRKLSQRVDHILRILDEGKSPQHSSPGSIKTPRDVPWAAKHILGITRIIRSSIFSRDRPLTTNESLSAARTLLHILESVVRRNYDSNHANSRRRMDRNLYFRLVGDKDQDFVINVLNLIPEAASQFLHSLERVLDEISLKGAPASYVDKYRALLQRLRTSSTGLSLKRQVQGQPSDRKKKRMK